MHGRGGCNPEQVRVIRWCVSRKLPATHAFGVHAAQADDDLGSRPNLAAQLRLSGEGIHARKLEMQAAMRELQVCWINHPPDQRAFIHKCTSLLPYFA